MTKINKLQELRNIRLGNESFEKVLKNMKFEDVNEYNLITKVEDLSIYITEEGDMDEELMLKDINKQKFLREQFLDTSKIRQSPEEESSLDGGGMIIRYKYEGPIDSKNRDFCSHMMTIYNISYFRKEDINMMSFSHPNNDFKRYSYWQYSGSYGCRHRFVAYIFSIKETSTGAPTTTIRRSASDSSPK